jgi:predicted nuclease with TOPRIM domain
LEDKNKEAESLKTELDGAKGALTKRQQTVKKLKAKQTKLKDKFQKVHNLVYG